MGGISLATPEIARSRPAGRLMAAVCVDTHAIAWCLAGDPRLSAKATAALDEATAEGEPIHVPSVCLVELTYLVEKGRIPSAARERLVQALDDQARRLPVGGTRPRSCRRL